MLWLRTHTGSPSQRPLPKKKITLIRDIHVPAGLQHSAAADPNLRPPATWISVEDIIENKLLFVLC